VEWIEIREKKVFLYRDGSPPTLNREVPIEDFLREVTASARRPGRGHHLLLPPGTRIAKLEGTVNVLCLEQPPQLRLIRWSDAAMGKGGDYQTYRLAFPYIVYLFLFFTGSFEDMRVYYRTAPLQGPNDALLMPNLWNVQADPEKPSACRACLRGTSGAPALIPTSQETVSSEPGASILASLPWKTGRQPQKPNPSSPSRSTGRSWD
jgi:hypothetical protein